MKPPNEEHTVSESTNHVYPKAAAGEQSANVAPNPSFPKLEESVLDYWDKDGTFQKSIERRPSGDHSQNEFVFFDGPPFANGLPHYGHLLTGYAKDVIPRYQTMKGHRVNRVFGWDTHGLPAELEAQKELGIDSVDQIKELGIDKFNDACRASVLKYTNEWKDYVHRQARWVDFEHGYKTLNITYMESVMWAFKQLYDKGLAYQGYRVLPYCPKDQTPLSAHELRMDADVYQDRQDTTVSVAVKLRDEEDAYAVFWTTTPWTVPTNFAIVVGADIDYVEVRPTEGKFAGKKFYLGKPLLGALTLFDGGFEGFQLLGTQFRAVLFRFFQLLLGFHTLRHRGCERNFLVRRQQRHLTDLLEVHAHGVVSREAVDQLVRVDELFLFDPGDLFHRRLHIVDAAVDGLGGADVDAERFERVVDLVELLALKVHLVDGLHQVAGAELALGLALGEDVHQLFIALQQCRRGQGGDQLFIQRGILLRGLFRLRGILVRFLGRCGLFRFLRQLDLLKIRLGEQRVGLFLQLSAGQLFFFHVCFPPLPLYLFFSIAAIRGSSLTAARLCASSKMILQ